MTFLCGYHYEKCRSDHTYLLTEKTSPEAIEAASIANVVNIRISESERNLKRPLPKAILKHITSGPTPSLQQTAKKKPFTPTTFLPEKSNNGRHAIIRGGREEGGGQRRKNHTILQKQQPPRSREKGTSFMRQKGTNRSITTLVGLENSIIRGKIARTKDSRLVATLK